MRTSTTISILFLAVVLSSGAIGCGSDDDSAQDIERWADEYCATAGAFISGFMGADVQPSGSWEASMAFINHYERTSAAAADAVSFLENMEVPKEARSLHSTTIDALYNVREAAEDGIEDVRNASNRALFQTAIDRYADRLSAEAAKLDAETQRSSSRIREHLQLCVQALLGQ